MAVLYFSAAERVNTQLTRWRCMHVCIMLTYSNKLPGIDVYHVLFLELLAN